MQKSFLFQALCLGLALAVTGCVDTNVSSETPPAAPTNVVNLTDPFGGPDLVTDVSQTPIPGTVIYDEVIPFSLTYTDATGASAVSTTGALQSRVIRSTRTGRLVFAYRFRDLVFNRNAPDQNGSYFIEIVQLSGFDTGDLPLTVYNLDTSQSLGGETWSGGPNVQIGQAGANDVDFEWNAFYSMADGTTFVAFSTAATRFKTGAYMTVGDQAFGSTRLTGIAVPNP